MHYYRNVAVVALALTVATPSPAFPQANGHAHSSSVKKAIYFLQNNPLGSSLIALDISNGQAANPVRTETGGKGASVLNATTNQPVGVDTLASQGSVVVDGDYMFVVNSGSNTLSMFQIAPSDPTRPQQIGEPIDTMGDFPVSVTYSDYLKTVCVANSGTRNSVACWKNDAALGLCPIGEPRPLGLDLATPPLMTSATVSQISFDPDQLSVIVTSKGPAGSLTPGNIYVIPVNNGIVGQEVITSAIATIPAPFGFAFGPSNTSFLLSDPTFGGSVVNLNPPYLQTSELKHQKLSLNTSCWASYSPTTGMGYLTDAGLPQLGEMDMVTGELKDVFNTDDAFMGGFDTVIDGATAYFIAAVPSIGIFDVQQKKTIQNLDLTNATGVDDRQWWQGMAMWGSS